MERLVVLIQEGRDQRGKARTVGKSLCVVQKAYQRYEKTGLVTRRSGFELNKAPTQRNDLVKVSASLRNRTASAVLLRNQPKKLRC